MKSNLKIVFMQLALLLLSFGCKNQDCDCPANFKNIQFMQRNTPVPNDFTGKWWVKSVAPVKNSPQFVTDIIMYSYKDGVLNGRSACWRSARWREGEEGEKLFWEKYYKKGNLEILKIYNLKNGKIWSEETFSKNKKNGKAIYWDISGVKIAEGIYKNGKPYSGSFRELKLIEPEPLQSIAVYADGELVKRSEWGPWE